MEFVVTVAVLVVIIVFPVMVAARMVGAGKTGFGSALMAVFLQACLSTAIRIYVAAPAVAVGIALVGGALVYAITLDTTVLRGFAISVIATIIAVVAIVLFAGMFGTVGIAP